MQGKIIGFQSRGHDADTRGHDAAMLQRGLRNEPAFWNGRSGGYEGASRVVFLKAPGSLR